MVGELWGVEDGWEHGTKLCCWVATLTAALSGCLGTWDPLSAWAATPLPAAPPPSPAVSFRSPNPFPPHVGDVKIPRKSRVVAPQAEAWFRCPAVPSRGRPGEGTKTPDAAGPTPPPQSSQIFLANSLLKSKYVSRAIFGRVRRVQKLNQTGRRGSLGV